MIDYLLAIIFFIFVIWKIAEFYVMILRIRDDSAEMKEKLNEMARTLNALNSVLLERRASENKNSIT